MDENDPSLRIHSVPVTFMVTAKDQPDATQRIRRALKLLCPYPRIGIVDVDISTPKEKT